MLAVTLRGNHTRQSASVMAATDCARSHTSISKHAGLDTLSPPSLPEATGLRFDPSVLMPRTRSPPGLTFSLELSVEALNAGNRQGLPCYPGLYRYPLILCTKLLRDSSW